MLTCKLQDVHNDIVYTSEKFGCDFKPHSGAEQSYTGEIKAVGLDLSVTKDMTLVWGVFAPTADAGSPEALKGRYLGASADVAVGAGAGANVLDRRRAQVDHAATDQRLGDRRNRSLRRHRGIRASLKPTHPECPHAGTPLPSGCHWRSPS